MIVGDFLQSATQTLKAANIDSARLDVLILLEDTIKQSRATLLAHPEIKIDRSTEIKLNNKIAQRATHLPLAYIRGKADFYGRTFAVSPDVLVPRPETEAMITLLKTTPFELSADHRPLHIADIGTGSGCLGISAAHELPTAQLDLYDIDPAALGVAAQNAKTHNLHIGLFHEDLLANAKHRRYDVILANLPYVPTAHSINQAATHEPQLAIFGGEDGLELYSRLWKNIKQLERQPAYVLAESLESQHNILTLLAADAQYRLFRTEGLVQQFKRIEATS